MTPLSIVGCTTQGDSSSWATISACGRYRYALGRSWSPLLPTFSIVMLNPSTADHDRDDPTLRKCLHFARQEGCGSLLVRNLFAWRATSPKELRSAPDPCGPLNERVLAMDLFFALRVAAWGQLSSTWLRRRAAVSISTAKMNLTHVLALTERGYDRTCCRETRQPRHPLYLPNATRAVRWSLA